MNKTTERKNQMNLSYQEVVAIAGLLKDGVVSEAKSQLIDGQSYQIAGTFDIEAVVNVSESFEVAQTCKALGLVDVAAILVKAGCMREVAVKLVVDAALKGDGESLRNDPRVVGIIEDVKERFQKEPKRTQRKISIKGEIEKVNPVVVAEGYADLTKQNK